MVKLYKEGDWLAITTDAASSYDFLTQMGELLEDLIEKKTFEYDWVFQFQYLIPLMSKMYNSYDSKFWVNIPYQNKNGIRQAGDILDGSGVYEKP